MKAAQRIVRVGQTCRFAMTLIVLTASVIAVAERPAYAAVEEAAKAATTVPPRIKQGEFSAAVLMWCGVLCVGVLMIAMVIIWGRGLRRMVRRPLKPVTEVDPLWYLKTTSRIPQRPPATNPDGNPPTP